MTCIVYGACNVYKTFLIMEPQAASCATCNVRETDVKPAQIIGWAALAVGLGAAMSKATGDVSVGIALGVALATALAIRSRGSCGCGPFASKQEK